MATVVERRVRALAGTFVAASLAFGVQGSPLFASAHFLWIAAFVAGNLLQSSVTNFCPAELILARLAPAPAPAPRR
jgi:hypothetical protein